MKALLYLAVFGWLEVTSFGQGQITINNRFSPDVNAPIILADGNGNRTPLSSPEWTVSFIGGFKGTPVGQLVPLTPGGSFFLGPAGSSDAGYFAGITATVPGVLPGQAADIVILAVNSSSGFKTPLGPFTVTTGSGSVAVPIVPLGLSPLFIPIPEPSVTELGLVSGLAALLLSRTVKQRQVDIR